jgi:saccharopine dehydrogenase (NADP+, L-glutamate forming)
LISTAANKLAASNLKERIISGLRWLCLFSNSPLPSVATPFDAVVSKLEEKLRFEPGERDLVFLHHQFKIEHTNGQKVSSSPSASSHSGFPHALILFTSLNDACGFPRLTSWYQETRTFTLAEYGDPTGYSAMARLVGVPCGVATLQVLNGTISKRGVYAPTTEEVCKPLRDSLKEYGITMKEKRVLEGQEWIVNS